jgi:hypothetical protein
VGSVGCCGRSDSGEEMSFESSLIAAKERRRPPLRKKGKCKLNAGNRATNCLVLRQSLRRKEGELMFDRAVFLFARVGWEGEREKRKKSTLEQPSIG